MSKKKEIPSFARTWMSLEDTVNEISQAQKNKYHMTSSVYTLYKSQKEVRNRKTVIWMGNLCVCLCA